MKCRNLLRGRRERLVREGGSGGKRAAAQSKDFREVDVPLERIDLSLAR